MLNAVNEVAHSSEPVKLTEKNLRNFWRKVSKLGSDECWLWTGCVGKKGYGQFGVNGNMDGAHRVSWQIHYGGIPSGLCVCHSCDNPPCVNPAHLWLGTTLDNILDKEIKGRGNQPKGEVHSQSKLTHAQVNEIRAQYAAGGTTQAAIGIQFGVADGTISDIINGITWKKEPLGHMK